MKPREARRKVMIQARMRDGALWSDALILNVSSRGLLIRSDQPPSRGSYLEIRRGGYVMVARVVWSNAGRIGVQTQDVISAECLISDPVGAAIPASSSATNQVERRAAPRATQVRHDSSREKARAIEFAAISLTCAGVAILIGIAMIEVVAKPVRVAQTTLEAP